MTPLIPSHGGQLRQIAERFNIDPSRLLDFSANINPEGPPNSVLSALSSALEDTRVLTNYPDLEETELRVAISKHTGLPPENIAVAHGVIPLMEATLHTLSIKRCLLPVPSFAAYRVALHHAGVEITAHVLQPRQDFAYDVDDLLNTLHTGAHDALLLANPQNPSGTACRHDELLRLVEEACKLKIRVLLDEAFIDYAPAQSLSREVSRLPNLTVFRSLTKFYSIPGLRVAYVAGYRSFIDALKDRLTPWAITTLASIAAQAALSDTAYASQTLQLNAHRRQSLLHELNRLGVKTYTPAANFLLLRLPDDADSTHCWERMLRDHKIVLRNCANFEALPPGHLRCLVRNDQDNRRLLEALSSVITDLRQQPQ